MSQKLNYNYLEYIICYSSLTRSEYLSSILDFYKPEFFQNEDVRCIMNIIVDFFQRRNVQPTLSEIKTFLTSKKDEENFIKFLTFVKNEKLNETINIDELFTNTEIFFRERAVYQALLSTTSTLAANKQIDTNEIFTLFQNACSISLIDNLGLDYFEQINKICDDLGLPNNVISTGWKWLDERIGGGWLAEGKALYVFTGFTNVGKSIFLGNLAVNIVKQNKNVLLVTLEMPESIYARRITSNITGIPINQLANDIKHTKESIINFKNNYTSKLIIKEFPTKSMTIHHLQSYIEKLAKKGIKIDALVVDYLNLMKNGNKTSGLYEDVKEISEQLRAITYRFKIPCITASQLNRKGAGVAEPGMETTSESIGLSFTADCQFSIWSDETDRAQGLIHLGIQKNRFGLNSGSVTLKIDYKTLTITEPILIPTTLSNKDICINSTDEALNSLNDAINK
jgi:replicative DNA helicase